jgi:hypothetical protein
MVLHMWHYISGPSFSKVWLVPGFSIPTRLHLLWLSKCFETLIVVPSPRFQQQNANSISRMRMRQTLVKVERALQDMYPLKYVAESGSLERQMKGEWYPEGLHTGISWNGWMQRKRFEVSILNRASDLRVAGSEMSRRQCQSDVEQEQMKYWAWASRVKPR